MLEDLSREACSPKTCANTLATLHSIVRYARRHGWVAHDPNRRARARRAITASASAPARARSRASSPSTSSQHRSLWTPTESSPSPAGTPHGHRNIARRGLGRAAERAELNTGEWPPLRFHDLRHTFDGHLILDLRLDVAQVSRILGHASLTITLDVYTHLFDDARHRAEMRALMTASAFAWLLDASVPDGEAIRATAAAPSSMAGRAHSGHDAPLDAPDLAQLSCIMR